MLIMMLVLSVFSFCMKKIINWRPVLSSLSTRQLQEQLLRSQSAGKISERQAPDQKMQMPPTPERTILKESLDPAGLAKGRKTRTLRFGFKSGAAASSG